MHVGGAGFSPVWLPFQRERVGVDVGGRSHASNQQGSTPHSYMYSGGGAVNI
jgi:hypothetical protein